VQEAKQTVDVYLGLGSNVEPDRHIAAGFDALRDAFGEVVCSPVYSSSAVGFSGADFLNAAARIRTRWSVGQLKTWLTKLENQHGRDRSQPKFSDRSLDIDILLHGDKVGVFDGLQLPRDEILEHAHVLRPLADIAPDLIHPSTGLSIRSHWDSFAGDKALKSVPDCPGPASSG
jgi:2-amino-4-hydroxy-6-hydroxymethyldihydropteridine diphosphokinase